MPGLKGAGSVSLSRFYFIGEGNEESKAAGFGTQEPRRSKSLSKSFLCFLNIEEDWATK